MKRPAEVVLASPALIAAVGDFYSVFISACALAIFFWNAYERALIELDFFSSFGLSCLLTVLVSFELPTKVLDNYRFAQLTLKSAWSDRNLLKHVSNLTKLYDSLPLIVVESQLRYLLCNSWFFKVLQLSMWRKNGGWRCLHSLTYQLYRSHLPLIDAWTCDSSREHGHLAQQSTWRLFQHGCFLSWALRTVPKVVAGEAKSGHPFNENPLN